MAVVIGCGNPLRGDDGVGAVVAACVGTALPGVRVVTTHQLIPELADTVARASFVVFVDAAIGGSPGEVHCAPVGDADTIGTRVGHTMAPETLLRLARETYGSAPSAWLVRVNAGDFDFGAPLSAPVSAAVPRAVDAIREIIETETSRPVFSRLLRESTT